jgi:hypothetical protein
MKLIQVQKIGWSLLLLLQFVVGAVLLVGATTLSSQRTIPLGASSEGSASSLLDRAASSGALLEQRQQEAVLRYCAGVREELERSNQEILDKQSTIRSTFMWTGIIFLACWIATLALLWLFSRAQGPPSVAAI